MSAVSDLLARLDKLGRVTEDTLLVLILGSMIVLAAGQIVLRNFFDISFLWSDELLRLLVLWVAVAGAVAASRNDKHINIAVLDRFLPVRLKAVASILVHLFTSLVSGVVCWYSIQFVRTSHEFGDVLLGDVPAWIPQIVLPVGFGLISYRYALFSVRDLGNLFSREAQS